MAGIFNLFGGITEHDRGSVAKTVARSKSTLGVSGNSAKALSQLKPKGLSIRSNSDLNVPVLPRASGSKQDATNKKQDFLKPRFTQADNNGRPISPSKELANKKQTLQAIKIKNKSPKVDLSESKVKKTKKLSDDIIFKKPLPPMKSKKTKIYREPEVLAFPYDFATEPGEAMDIIDKELVAYILGKKMGTKAIDDEGFESDPYEEIEEEVHISPNIPPLAIHTKAYELPNQITNIELPQISDNEDY